MSGPDVYTALNLKGGVGKTTTAMMLAEAAAQAGRRVMVIDTDPQASCTKWWVAARDADDPLSFGLEQIPKGATESVEKVVARLSDAYDPDVFIVDTASAGSGDRDRINDAVAAATGCIVPCRASTLEVPELADSLHVAATAASTPRPAKILRVAVDMRMREAAQFIQFLQGEGWEQFRDAIPYNAEMLRLFGRRPPKLYGYQHVWAELAGE